MNFLEGFLEKLIGTEERPTTLRYFPRELGKNLLETGNEIIRTQEDLVKQRLSQLGAIIPIALSKKDENKSIPFFKKQPIFINK